MTITVEDLVSLVRQERDAAISEQAVSELLSDEALVDRGEALTEVAIVEHAHKELVVRCPRNESRIRPGARVELSREQVHLSGSVVDLRDQGCMLHIRVERDTRELASGPWILREAFFDISDLLLQCLRKLQPGAPGWGTFKVLSGQSKPSSPLPASPPERLDVLHRALAECSVTLDSSQISAASACLGLPAMLGIQGPPGTGKTQVLAVVAETLARLGKRILLVAPTHQAVNNSLSTIRTLFPTRRLAKVGDELRRESLNDGIECRLLKDVTRGLAPEMHSEVITGMTFVSAMHHLALKTSGLAPNVVLIDEAGQLPFHQGACAGLMGAGALLLFGDDAQMPPVFCGDVQGSPAAVSLFARLRQVAPAAIRALEISYRLNDELCEIIARHFYSSPNAVRPSCDAAGRRLTVDNMTGCPPAVATALTGDHSLVWVKSPATPCQQANPCEARYVAELVITSLASSLSPSGVAVVTPFRRQAALIRRHVQALQPGLRDLPIIDTVERVQGLTVELIILSMCVSDPDYASGLAPFLFSPNRLNVALSRAKRKAIAVVAPSAFMGIPSAFDGLQGRQLCREVLNAASLVVQL